jgi:predicted Zn-dependent peptidase
VPANATLVLAGDIDLAEARALCDRYFGSFPASTRPARPDPALPQPAYQYREVTDKFAALTRIHRAWTGPRAFETHEPELDLLAQAWCAVGTGALWKRLVYETQLAQRVSAWTQNSRLGGEVHVAVDLRSGSDPAAVRAILDEECARGIDEAAIARAVTRREAAAIWGLSGLTRRAALVQRYALYDVEIDSLAHELRAYREVTPASIDAALAHWLPGEHMLEVTTVPASAAG